MMLLNIIPIWRNIILNNHLAHIGLGWVYYERDNDKNLAINEFSAATRKNPASGAGYFAAAQLYSKENEYSLADE